VVNHVAVVTMKFRRRFVLVGPGVVAPIGLLIALRFGG
jgi:hypothetical protein